jgi:MFS family permease
MSAQPNQFALLTRRRFLPFFVTQFLGALNDNVFKNALLIVLAYRGGRLFGLEGPILLNLAAAIFILPYVFLSASAGQWADKFEKTRLMRLVKLAEILIMLLGAFGFATARTDLLFLALLLMGCHSTIFGPAKYALLPQHLRPEELVGGNGLIEMGTFVAILLGTLLGGGLVASHELGVVPVSLATLAIAVAGYFAARWIPEAPASDPGLVLNPNPLTETLANLRAAARDRTMLLALIANSWFWFYGATFLTQFPSYAHDYLAGDETVTILLLTALSIGIGTGSLLCERLSRGGLNLGLVPFGLAGMTVFAGSLSLAGPRAALHSLPGTPGGPPLLDIQGFLTGSGAATLAILLGMGVCAGLYIVPLYALIQTRADRRQISRIIAANNVLNALAMVLSSGLAIALFARGATIPQVFDACALATLAFLCALCFLAPEYPAALKRWRRRGAA